MTHTSLARAQSIYSAAIRQEPLNRYLLASFRNLQRHKESGAFDHYAALRLLRNNVRDLPDTATLGEIERDYIAARLLQFWRLQWRPIGGMDETAQTE